MPGMGGGTMAGNMLQGMFGPKPQGGGGGGGQAGPFGAMRPTRDSPWNNWGAGDAPQQLTPAMIRYQKQCLAGDGYACNQLQVLQAEQQQNISNFYDQANKRQQWHESAMRGNPMSAGRGR